MGGANTKENILTDEDIEFMVKNSDLTDEDVKQMYSEFIDNHPDGKITKDEFKETFEKILPRADMKSLEKLVFRMFDTDGDGTINFKEFMTVFYLIKSDNPEDLLKMIFRLYDANGNKSINRAEMDEIVKFLLKMEGDASKEDMKWASEEAFKEMDADEDGNITESEFIKAIQNEEEVSQHLSGLLLNITLGGAGAVAQESDSD